MGRIGIFEVLEVDDRIRDLIIDRRPSGEIKRAAVGKGMRTLREDGILKVELGETTLEEVARTTAAGALAPD